MIRKVTECSNKVSAIRCRRSVWGVGWGGVGGCLCVCVCVCGGGGVGVGGGLPSLSVYVIIAIVHSVMFIRHRYCFSVTTRGQL